MARLQHVRLCSADAKLLSRFYESALGFRQVAVEHLSGARAQERFGMAGRVLRITLALGAQRVKLVQFVDRPGCAYPADLRSSDVRFQHIAIVVSDMTAAMAQLSQVSGWSPITRYGPQQLPISSGGVTAFKFRDPEGHPLELLAFPDHATPAYWSHMHGQGAFLGIDHSAISVADSARSIAFYEGLGLSVSGHSLNDDATQGLLDDLAHPVVEVTALSADHVPPHLELLCYRESGRAAPTELRVNDIATTCLIFEPMPRSARPPTGGRSLCNLVDPDGHHLAISWPES
ncbi:hypothetical protein PY254_08370 [Rhodanobacter sp. AS-Z3]|uniref:VOC family protein n=1 Tax=Rhodanobacter sp. AS-Z3 TaxID=3031330 RepID=UPI002478E6CB|nr:VOC family protein [Rhodanobacter sp. AS-Z3]WEN16668.1 hypothetical protein PY254_08370 [Rhodanobacter sp. AS-Z3]